MKIYDIVYLANNKTFKVGDKIVISSDYYDDDLAGCWGTIIKIDPWKGLRYFIEVQGAKQPMWFSADDFYPLV